MSRTVYRDKLKDAVYIILLKGTLERTKSNWE